MKPQTSNCTPLHAEHPASSTRLLSRFTFHVSRSTRAFTLIELLVVIAIMAILAALILSITSAVKKAQMRNRAKAELEEIAAAIDNYKTTMNHYPPASTNFNINPLYYELEGTTLGNNIFKTLDGSAQIDSADVLSAFRLNGFVNSTRDQGGEGRIARRFIPAGLRAGQFSQVLLNGRYEVTVLGTAIEGPAAEMLLGTDGKAINPWRYNPVNPTNNVRSYDLWVDIAIGNRTERISNWSDKPIVL